MVKLFNVYYPKRTLQLFVFESFLITIALTLPAVIHFRDKPLNGFVAEFGFLKIAMVAVTCLFFLYYSNLYAPSILRNPDQVSVNFLKGFGIASIVIATTYHFLPGLELYRGFAVTGISLATILLVSNRTVLSGAKQLQASKEGVVILGDGKMARLVANVIQERSELGFTILGYVGDRWRMDQGVIPPLHLGEARDLARIAREFKPNRVIVAMGDQRGTLPIEDLLELKTSGITVQDGTDFYEVATGKLPVESVRLSWLIFSPGFKVSKMTLIYKRAISLLLAFVGLAFLSPLIALISVAIRLDSRGPIIFRQKRVGLRGQPFTLFKFRTMHINADQGGYARPAEHDDQRITRVGRWLRRFRLDEIPQLWNILLGQMYFVGPRPFVSEQEMECVSQIPLYSYRWSVRPGATGWAQVQRGYCATLQDNIDKLSYDLFYIKNMSIGFDLLIIFKTIKIVLTAQGGR
jgi:exopolysaccharide biosynthesis polyprenyl glycosylphosphotransferase